jgi:ABC-type uncharacterized transport system permease subunit
MTAAARFWTMRIQAVMMISGKSYHVVQVPYYVWDGVQTKS